MKPENKTYSRLDSGLIIQLEYDENNKPKRTVILDSPIAKKYSAYVLMNKDIDLVLDAIDNLQSNKNSAIINQSLSFFAIINYAKCFVSNTGRGTFLKSDVVFKNADSRLIAEHSKIINIRMDYVAHAGNTYEKCPITAILHYSQPESYTQHTFVGGRIVANLYYLTDLSRYANVFAEVCFFVKAYLENQIERILLILEKETFDLSYEEIFKRSFIPE